ncbi:MAG: hypothetical protein JSS99_03900 [Actinobacteria bacterium]|nr:hypothetical protein [Actinomycetota bacterium]
MTVRTRLDRPRTRPRVGRAVGRRRPAPTVLSATPPAQPAAQLRERDSGGPQDRAAYACACGYVFEAPVSTTVGCPHCGGTQAW